ncbi:MAG TPA: carbohydrate ABC transporter permease [Candidatus Faeciplasma avium]|uniref:Carbohydrate ABC transporter permease n=1 Tax=Candidatus Faeciplasma avium TaxID=2840798 RepID=A0A9D1NR42_9FIRM|nr:carbohydrate ABC transporter permease [Candidatus Faeciplasma avium]
MASDVRISAEKERKIQEKKLKKLRRRKVNVDTVHVKKSKGKKINGSLGGDIAIFMLLGLLGLFMIFPLYYSIIQSFKPISELFVFPPKLYVLSPTTENFSNLFKVAGNLWVPFSRYVFNSVFITVVISVFHVIVVCCCAYCLSKCRFPGYAVLNQIIVTSLLFTSTATWIMQFVVMAKLGMINSYSALILPSIATPMGLYLMRQSMSTINDSIIDAAKVDGAGVFRTCWQVVIPNQKPAIATLIIYVFQGAWNVQGGALVYEEDLKTLPTIMSQIAASGIARQGIIYASAVVLMIPPLVIFLVAQSNVMETMANSGMKD